MHPCGNCKSCVISEIGFQGGFALGGGTSTYCAHEPYRLILNERYFAKFRMRDHSRSSLEMGLR